MTDTVIDVFDNLQQKLTALFYSSLTASVKTSVLVHQKREWVIRKTNDINRIFKGFWGCPKEQIDIASVTLGGSEFKWI